MRNPNPIKKIYLTLVLFAASLSAVNSQDLHFSQFFEAPLLRNPALAGIFTGDYRIQGVYRDQWNSFTNATEQDHSTASINYPWAAPTIILRSVYRFYMIRPAVQDLHPHRFFLP